MATRHNTHVLSAAFVPLIAFSAIQPRAIAAEPVRKPTSAAQEVNICKRYVHERKGHPGKGLRRVKVVYVPCEKRK